QLEGGDLARLCQIVENQVVGAPCGIMDQVTCSLGRAGSLLALRCQPAELLGHHPVPSEVELFGISSGVKHSVGGGRYARARCAGFMGLRMIEGQIGERLGETPCPVVALYQGYLCNISPEEFYRRWRPILALRIVGAEYLERYGTTFDPVTKVNPDETYS